MDIKNIETIDSPLLRRKEIKAKVFFDKEVPSRAKIKELLEAKLGIKSNSFLILEKIKTHFGKKEADIFAKQYNDAKVMNKIETKRMVEKNFPKKEEEVKSE
jgi:ribosomal protein S24E